MYQHQPESKEIDQIKDYLNKNTYKNKPRIIQSVNRRLKESVRQIIKREISDLPLKNKQKIIENIAFTQD